jgi:hypothetical protein
MAEPFANSWGGGLNIKDGQLDFSGLSSLIENFQSDGIDYLYDIEPQSNNLFWAGFFREGEDPQGKPYRQLYNAQFRIRKVTISYPKLDVQIHPVLRTPLVQKASYPQEVTIEWFEDVYHSIKQFHHDWLARWYSRKFDVLRCGTSGKFKKLLVIAFHYVNDAKGPVIIESPRVQPIMAFFLGGLVPKGVPDQVFDYSSDGNDQSLSIQYTAGHIDWVYSNEIGLGFKLSDINANQFSYGDGEGLTWAGNGYVSEPADQGDAVVREQYRVTRSATSSLVA